MLHRLHLLGRAGRFTWLHFLPLPCHWLASAKLGGRRRARDDPHGPQWHFMDHSADMRLPIPPLVRAEHPAMGDMCAQERSLEGLVDYQVTAEPSCGSTASPRTSLSVIDRQER